MTELLFPWCERIEGRKPDPYHSLCIRSYVTGAGVTRTCTCEAHKEGDT